MDLDTWVKAAPPIAGVLVTLAGIPKALGPDRERRMLLFDAQMLSHLPTGSAPHDRLLANLDQRLAVQLEHDVTARRDLASGVLAILMTAGLAWLTVWLIPKGPLGVAAAVVSFLAMCFFAFGTAESLARVPRDDKGVRLRR